MINVTSTTLRAGDADDNATPSEIGDLDITKSCQ